MKWKGYYLEYLSSIALYGLSLVVVKIIAALLRLHPAVMKTMLLLYCGYILLAPGYYRFLAKEVNHTSHSVWRALLQFLRGQKPSRENINALLFLAVKIFFLPLMLSFLLQNTQALFSDYQEYALLLTVIFTIDTFIFTLGYTFESSILQNKVKSVEPTLLGWLVTLVCYPPLNDIVGKYLPWPANEYVFFWNDSLTWLFQAAIIILLLLYLSATMALGTKASNLTNRGIVAKFPYSIVRHPAYASKVLVWWITLLPVISLLAVLVMVFWTLIYYLRAITEERHLRADAEYQQYMRKVSWKFIPGIW